MVEKLCKNCKFWDNTSEHGNWGICTKGDTNMDGLEDKSTLMYAVDNEDYKAWVVTSSEFGCIMFEEK